MSYSSKNNEDNNKEGFSMHCDQNHQRQHQRAPCLFLQQERIKRMKAKKSILGQVLKSTQEDLTDLNFNAEIAVCLHWRKLELAYPALQLRVYQVPSPQSPHAPTSSFSSSYSTMTTTTSAIETVSTAASIQNDEQQEQQQLDLFQCYSGNFS